MSRERWQFDHDHSSIGFSAKHMMVTTVRGSFQDYDVEVDVDEADLTQSSVVVTIQAASITTGTEGRDTHLRSADFLEVEKYPTITFRSTSIEHLGAEKYRLHGDLTIRDVTRPVVLEAESIGIIQDPMRGRRLAGAATVKINREDWGLTWNMGLEAGGWLVSKEITLEIELAAYPAQVAVPA